ncbi:DUF6942 family protein [Colwellia sp. MEBiC06753]
MHYYGLGDLSAPIYIYIENVPPLPLYQQLDDMHAMSDGEVFLIAEQTGNHWRKIFNVLAKLAFERIASNAPAKNPSNDQKINDLKSENVKSNFQRYASWQALRDNSLLQAGSEQCLLFNKPEFDRLTSDKTHIIMGKQYADKTGIAQHCFWLNEFFAYHQQKKIIICPYFDYRQLSNIKITQLVKLIEHVSQ